MPVTLKLNKPTVWLTDVNMTLKSRWEILEHVMFRTCKPGVQFISLLNDVSLGMVI
jgi:hypothetical protein